MKHFYETHNGKTIYLEEVASIEPIKPFREFVRRYAVHLHSGEIVDDYAFQFVKGDLQQQVENWEGLQSALKQFKREMSLSYA